MKRRSKYLLMCVAIVALFACGESEDASYGGAGLAEAQDPSGQGGAPSREAQPAPAYDASAAPQAELGESDGVSEAEPPIEEEPQPAEEIQWIQLSTDDSTSMASAQLNKANAYIYGHGLKVHEFLNYYDPPISLFAAEEFSRAKAIDESLRFGVKAVYAEIAPQDDVDLEGENVTTEEVEDSDTSERDEAMGAPIETSPIEEAEPPVEEEEPPVENAVGELEVLFQMQADPVAEETRRNWNLFLCVDVSGSMGGEKLAFTIEALQKMLSHLKEGDRLTLTTFESEARNIFVDLEYTTNEATIRNAFRQLEAQGGTNMIQGLRNSYELAQNNFREGMLHRVILFGDGSANVGDTDLEVFSRLTRINGQEGIYLSGIGVGVDYAFERMDALTDAGKGAHIFLPNRQEVDIIFGDYFQKVVEVAADGIAIEATLPEGIRLSAFSGEEVSFDPNQRLQNIVLAAGDDMTFTATFEVTDEAALDQAMTLKVTLRPLSSGEEVIRKIEVDSIRELIAEPGRLFERTRLIHRYGEFVVNGAEEQSALLQDLEAYPDPDWGIREIINLLQR